jgi:hypothetical protein
VVPQLGRVQRPGCVAEFFHRYLEDQEARCLDPLSGALLLLLILREVARAPAEASRARGAALAGRVEAYVTHHLTEKLSTRPHRPRPARQPRLPGTARSASRARHGDRVHPPASPGGRGRDLRDSTDGIAEIAAACGYPSVGHFRRLFLRHPRRVAARVPGTDGPRPREHAMSDARRPTANGAGPLAGARVGIGSTRWGNVTLAGPRPGETMVLGQAARGGVHGQETLAQRPVPRWRRGLGPSLPAGIRRPARRPAAGWRRARRRRTRS